MSIGIVIATILDCFETIDSQGIIFLNVNQISTLLNDNDWQAIFSIS